MARKREWWESGKVQWEDHLNQVLLTKPAEVVQEACQVLEKHGCPVKKLKSELYYSSTLFQVVFQVLQAAATQLVKMLGKRGFKISTRTVEKARNTLVVDFDIAHVPDKNLLHDPLRNCNRAQL